MPPYLRLGSVCIVPVGFVDATYFWRDKAANSRIGSNFGSIPYNNTVGGKISEDRFSIQNSRLGFRADGDWKGAHFIGYNEFDFLGQRRREQLQRHQRRSGSPHPPLLGGCPQRRLGVSSRPKLEHADTEPRGDLAAAGRPLLLASLRRELYGRLDLDSPARLPCALSLRQHRRLGLLG